MKASLLAIFFSLSFALKPLFALDPVFIYILVSEEQAKIIYLDHLIDQLDLEDDVEDEESQEDEDRVEALKKGPIFGTSTSSSNNSG